MHISNEMKNANFTNGGCCVSRLLMKRYYQCMKEKKKILNDITGNEENYIT